MGQSTSSWRHDCPSPTPPTPQSDLRPQRPEISRCFINKKRAAEEAENDGNKEESHDEEIDEGETCDRDLRGRRHVRTDKNHDGTYVMDTHDSSLFVRFPQHGDSTDAMLRAYLQTYIPNHMLLDEYGHVCSINDISTAHIAVIQGKLWREIPQGLAARSSLGIEDVTDYDQLAAECVEMIAHKLEMDHVFVVRKRPLNAPLCSFGLCSELHHEQRMPHQPNIIALEPTIGFMTLDATNLFLFHGKIFVFRRTSDKYSKYGLNIENILPKERLAYCIECLQHLWDRRIHVWSTRGKFNGSFERFKHGFRADDHSYDSSPSRHSSQHRDTRHTTPLDFGGTRSDKEDTEDVECYSDDDEEYDEASCTDTQDATSHENRPLPPFVSDDQGTNGASIEPYLSSCDSAADNANTTMQLSLHLEGANDEAPTTPQETSDASGKLKMPLGVSGLLSRNDLSPRELRARAREASTAKRVSTKRVNNAALPFTIYTAPQWVAINNPPPRISTSTAVLRQMSSNRTPMQPTARRTMSHEEVEYVNDPMDLTDKDSADEESLEDTFQIPIYEQFRGARAGVPLGDPVEYQHKKGISFPAPPMLDLGPMFPEKSRDLHMERPRVYEGGVTRQAIITSAIRASGVKISNRELGVPSPVRTGFRHEPSSSLGSKATSVNSWKLHPLAAKGNSLQPFLATSNMERALLPANPIHAAPIAHIKSPTSMPSHLTFVKPVNLWSLTPKPPNPITASNFRRFQFESSNNQALSSTQVAQRRTRQVYQFQQPDQVPALPILCTCRKPSRVGDNIVTCTNTACPISTYHYRCLDKSQKLSTRGTKWMCALCKATALYAAKAAKRPSAETKSRFPFTKQDIEDAFVFPSPTAAKNPYGIGLGPYNGYQPEKYGVEGSRLQNGEVRTVYGVDAAAKIIEPESESSLGSSSSDGDDGLGDFVVDDELDASSGVPDTTPSTSGGPCIVVATEESAPVSRTPPPVALLSGGGGMKRVYAVDSPIPQALRTWEIADEEDSEEDSEDDDDEDDEWDDTDEEMEDVEDIGHVDALVGQDLEKGEDMMEE